MVNVLKIDEVKLFIPAIFVIILMFTGCAKTEKYIKTRESQPPVSQKTRRTSTADYSALRLKLADMKPTGWDFLDQVSHYTPESLYEIINGAAELYLAYDVVALTYANLADEVNADNYLDLYVYDMGSPTNAFGIFSVEKGINPQPVQLGRDAYWSDSSLFIWYGDYYIIIALPSSDSELKNLSQKLAQDIVSNLKDTGEPVQGLATLPKKGLLENTIRYFRVDAMGLHFLSDTFVAEYLFNQTRMTTFISTSISEQAAKKQFDGYLDHAGKYGKVTDKVQQNGTLYAVCDMGDGIDVIFLKDNQMGGVVSTANPDVAIKHLTDFVSQLDD